MYKLDLALNNLQWLICHKTKPIYKASSHKLIRNLSGRIFLLLPLDKYAFTVDLQP